MAESPLLPATTPAGASLATMDASQLPRVQTTLDETPESKREEFHPNTSAAIFSTELCTRAPRPPPGPPYSPVIVRGSDPVKAVVEAARFWQQKFKWQCLCIFPGQNWDVNDLWDAQDLHFDSPGFCQKMLNFIERDTYYAAKQFAKDWSKAHPDRYRFVVGDKMDTCDPNDPLAIVDSIFIHGETNGFPRTFLWHVAHMMDATLADANGSKNVVLRASHVEQLLRTSQKAIEANTKATGVDPEAFDTTNSSLPKKNLTLQSVQKLSSAAAPPALTPSILSAAPSHPVLKREPKSSSPHLNYKDSISNYLGAKTGSSIRTPSGHSHGGKSFRGKNRNAASGSFNYFLPPQGWAENVNHLQSSPYPRHVSGMASIVQNSQFIHPTMAMGQPIIMAPGVVSPYMNGVTILPPAIPNESFDPGVSARGMPAGQAMPTQTPPMAQAYLSQTHYAYGNRGVSIGDMTNTLYHSNNTLSQQMDHRRPVSRRSSSFHNHGVLFDPYGGANPKFSEATAYNASNKAAHHTFANQPGRSRKMSASSNRPRQGQYGSDYPINTTMNRFRTSDSPFTKNYTEDDPTITGDSKYGCSQFHIGPDNQTVKELFVGALPEDVQQFELRQLFEQQAGVSPTQIDIRPALQVREFSHRLHAFVSFSSASDAKKALQIRDQNPFIRNGSVAVVVTVPRRFYQKASNAVRRASVTSGTHNALSYSGRTIERDPRNVTHVPSHNEKSVGKIPQKLSEQPRYSPQDARSDLHKNETVPRKSDLDDPASCGSPEARKARTRQSPPTNKKDPTRDISTELKITEEERPGDDVGSAEILSLNSTEAVTNAVQSNTPTAEEPIKVIDKASSSGTVEERSTSTSPANTSQVINNESEPLGDLSSVVSKQQETLKIGFDGEEIEMQPIPVLSPVVAESPKVKMPLETAGDFVAVEQVIEDTKSVNLEQSSEEFALSSSIMPAANGVLGNEEKKDNTIHLSKESLAREIDTEPQPDCREEPCTVNQDLIDSTTIVVTGPASPESISSARAEPEIPPIEQFKSSKDNLGRSTSTTSEHRIEDTAISPPAIMAATNSDSVPESRSKASNTLSVKSMPAPASGGMGTLPTVGAQRIESLSPFAKPSRAQQKKEKESKKKQLKKAEAGKAKAVSALKPNAPSTSGANNEHGSLVSTENAEPDVKVKLTEVGLKHSTQAAAQANKKVKKKGKPLTGGVDDEVKPKENQPEDNIQSKGEVNANTSVNSSLVIHENNKVPITAQEEPEKKASPAGSLDAVMTHEHGTPPFTLGLLKSPVKLASPQPTLKKKKPFPAVPHLKFPLYHSSAYGRETQPPSPAGTLTPSSSPAMVTIRVEHVMGQPTTQPEATSTASSATVQAGDEVLTSASPFEDAFFTPQQTPATPNPSQVQTTGVDAHQDEVPKKKKKKSKKKAKKAAGPKSELSESLATGKKSQTLGSAGNKDATTTSVDLENPTLSETGSGVDLDDSHLYDPFESQMTHIDAVRRGLKDPNAYWNYIKAERQAEEEKKAAAAKEAEKLSESSLRRQIESYMRERKSRFRAEAKALSKKDID